MQDNNTRKIKHTLSKYPEFGTFCETDPTTFFFPFAPKDKTCFTDNYIISDALFLKKDTFYLMLNDNKKSKLQLTQKISSK